MNLRGTNSPTIRTTAFESWLTRTTPAYRWDWPYIRHIREHLDQVTARSLDKLAIFCPPRHGKSSLATIHYPAYRLEHDPSLRIVVACYNQTLAEKFSRRIRAICRANGVVLDPERQAVDDWQTAAGGGLRAVGVGGGVTGQGFDLVIIDDPVKSREEANSEAYRERCWDWYREDIYTRQEPGAALVLIQTRWHMDDLAGRILASDQAGDWTIVNLPAEAEANDPLGRPLGAPLCPDRYDLAALGDLRATLGTYGYAALFQGRPIPAEGGLFKSGRLGWCDAQPATVRGRIRAWDLAATANGGDYTCGVLLSVTNEGRYVVEDVVRGQWDSDRRDAMLREVAERDGRGVPVRIPQDPGQAGKSQVAALLKVLAGWNVITELETGDKTVRADPFSSQWNGGNVDLVRAPWNNTYLDEFHAFPNGRHDDQVDPSAAAFNYLTRYASGVRYAPSLFR